MAGLIPPSTLEQIRAASDIVEIIGAVVPLKRAGTNFVGLCPFHREKTPSCNVSPAKQVFKCFGCGKGGDVFTFIREYENLPFMDAVRRLAERARIPLQLESGPGAEQARSFKDSLLQMHEQIAARWHTAACPPSGTTHPTIACAGLIVEALPSRLLLLLLLLLLPPKADETARERSEAPPMPPLLLLLLLLLLLP